MGVPREGGWASEDEECKRTEQSLANLLVYRSIKGN